MLEQGQGKCFPIFYESFNSFASVFALDDSHSVLEDRCLDGARFQVVECFVEKLVDVLSIRMKRTCVEIFFRDCQVEGILLQLDTSTKRLTLLRQEMKQEMTHSEKDLNAGPCHTNAQHINQLFHKAFNNLKSSEQDYSESVSKSCKRTSSGDIAFGRNGLQNPHPDLGPCPTDVEMIYDACWSLCSEKFTA
ncbi:hypothetical protein COOONC_15473 [Cooperia oncophora]